MVTSDTARLRATEPEVLQWQVIISTQMHFNEMILRTRAIGSSAVLAVYGYAASILIEQPKAYEFLFDQFVPTAAIVIMFGLALLTAIFFVDVCYYYRMLLATVNVGLEFEQENPGIVNQTTKIANRVSLFSANAVVFVFYLIPLALGAGFLWHVMQKYPFQLSTLT